MKYLQLCLGKVAFIEKANKSVIKVSAFLFAIISFFKHAKLVRIYLLDYCNTYIFTVRGNYFWTGWQNREFYRI